MVKLEELISALLKGERTLLFILIFSVLVREGALSPTYSLH
jgi:hypothetical protein